MCQGFNHYSAFLLYFVLGKLATISRIRANIDYITSMLIWGVNGSIMYKYAPYLSERISQWEWGPDNEVIKPPFTQDKVGNQRPIITSQ